MDEVADSEAKRLMEETVEEARSRLDPSSGPSLMYARNPEDVATEVQDLRLQIAGDRSGSCWIFKISASQSVRIPISGAT